MTQNDSGFALGYSDINTFGNIQLSQKASVDVSGEDGGSIQVQAGRLSVCDDSSLLSIITGSKPGGELTVTTPELLVRDGASVSVTNTGTVLLVALKGLVL